MNNFDAKKVKNEIVQWIKDWFNENGKGCCAVVGISGGKDSSVVAALCVEALGKDRVFGVLMPQGEQSDIDFSYKLVRHLDINNCIVNIGDTISTLINEVKPKLNNQWSKQTSTNLPARIRMATLYAVSQTINGRVANTCNLSIIFSAISLNNIFCFYPFIYCLISSFVAIFTSLSKYSPHQLSL